MMQCMIWTIVLVTIWTGSALQAFRSQALGLKLIKVGLQDSARWCMSKPQSVLRVALSRNHNTADIKHFRCVVVAASHVPFLGQHFSSVS